MASLIEEFQEVGRDLYAAGLVSSQGGNLSVREGEALLVTCHGSRLGHLEEDDLQWTAVGSPAPDVASMDTSIHQAIYRATEADAIVHGHPRHAIALSLTDRVIEPQDLEGQHCLGTVPVVAREGDVAGELAQALREHPVAVVAGHGSYARGESLWQALRWTSVLEESAQVLWLLRMLKQRT
jgi:L-fuculose-phosphate aldolase